MDGTDINGLSPHFLFEEKTPEDGVVRLEKWPEGYELWYHGRRVWSSAPEGHKTYTTYTGL